jgi:uncharacterized repeat protein (TIGR03803 family)
MTLVLAPVSAGAAVETVIFSFNGAESVFPNTGLVMDPSGILYGTTNGSDLGVSTAYKLTPPALPGGSYALTLLHRFANAEGGLINAGLLPGPGGVLYGDASLGGAFNKGTVFSLTPAANPADPPNETTLYAFSDGRDGGRPSADLISDADGALYGTTSEGGTKGCANSFGRIGCGVVFKLIPPTTSGGAWAEKVLYRFKGGADGNAPLGVLLFDSKGALFGTTSEGGAAGHGTVFSLTPAEGGWRHRVLHSFQGAPDGASPVAGLVQGASGAFYGVTRFGGTGVCPGGNAPGCGTVFSITRSGMLKVLHSFTGGPADGAQPEAVLLSRPGGVFYGTTFTGGSVDNGTVFKISPPSVAGGSWSESIAYAFSHSPGDGALPLAGLIADGSGALYGTTAAGGSSGEGTVFRLTP